MAETTKLTPQKLNAAKPHERAYKISDPACSGLFVLIQPGGTKTFIFNFSLLGRRSEVTLGRYPSISLSEAREAAVAARRMVERGENPAKLKKAEKAAAKAAAEPVSEEGQFKAFAETWQAEELVGLAESYKAQIASRLERFVYPSIGRKALKDVRPKDVLDIVKPIKDETPGTAEGVRTIIERIFNHAIKLDAINEVADPLEQNPALPLRGHVKVPKTESARHLSPKELGAFWKALGRQHGAHPSTIAAAKLLMYSMTRKSEVLRARWVEFDLENGTWDVPSERIKTDLPHRVFLSRQAREVLEVQHAVTGHLEYVFPSAFRDKVPLAEVTLNHLFKRMDFGVSDFSPHGTRSTAATLLLENGESPTLVELLLAHAVKGVAKHYHKHQLIEDRKRALQWLADEIDRLAAAATKQPAAQPAEEAMT